MRVKQWKGRPGQLLTKIKKNTGQTFHQSLDCNRQKQTQKKVRSEGRRETGQGRRDPGVGR